MAAVKKVRPTFPQKRYVEKRGPRPGLAYTDTPGVFRNKAGVLVNGSGVAITFKELQKKDNERLKEVDGNMPSTPAELLRTLAFDPRLPLAMRVDLAHKAAPFFSAKRVAIQGGGPEAPPIDIRQNVEKLPQGDLDKLEHLLNGVEELLAKGEAK
jgi:hypothetical protein